MIYLDEPDLDYIPSTRGQKVKEFERACADYLGVDDCVAVNSGTSALFLSLLACGIGPGDEVIVPACTFVGTANAVLYTGAKIVLHDVELDTWNLYKIHSTDKTKTILIVHLYGNIQPISHPLTRSTKVFFISDAACCFGAKEINSHYACYSFNGNKTITTGGGGLIVGQNLDKIRDMLTPGLYDGLGWNMGMSAINAALGLEQLERIDEYIWKKKQFNKIYREELNGLVKFQEPIPNSNPVWWMTACLFDEKIDIQELQMKLKDKGIPTRRIFKPLNHYSHLTDGLFYSNSEHIYKHGLCLPSSVKNSEDDIYTVCRKIKDLIG